PSEPQERIAVGTMLEEIDNRSCQVIRVLAGYIGDLQKIVGSLADDQGACGRTPHRQFQWDECRLENVDGLGPDRLRPGTAEFLANLLGVVSRLRPHDHPKLRNREAKVAADADDDILNLIALDSEELVRIEIAAVHKAQSLHRLVSLLGGLTSRGVPRDDEVGVFGQVTESR